MYIINNNKKFYGSEIFEYYSATYEFQHGLIIVVRYLLTKKSRTPKINTFFYDDIVATDDYTLIGLLIAEAKYNIYKEVTT